MPYQARATNKIRPASPSIPNMTATIKKNERSFSITFI